MFENKIGDLLCRRTDMTNNVLQLFIRALATALLSSTCHIADRCGHRSITLTFISPSCHPFPLLTSLLSLSLASAPITPPSSPLNPVSPIGAVLSTVKTFINLTAKYPDLQPQVFLRAKAPLMTLITGGLLESSILMQIEILCSCGFASVFLSFTRSL
jgi:hypothetical protein